MVTQLRFNEATIPEKIYMVTQIGFYDGTILQFKNLHGNTNWIVIVLRE